MTFAAHRVTVTTTATELTGAVSAVRYGPGRGFPQRTVEVYVPTGEDIYVGSSAVTTSTGRLLIGGDSYSVDLYPGETMWGIVASGTAVAHVTEAGS